MSKDPYLELIAALAPPTSEQSSRFAQFVAGAHSWYKHLPPFPPGAKFIFYLDPNAGRDLVRLPSGEAGYSDRVDGQRGIHYTWMPTAAYREEFGHWSYHTAHGSRVFLWSAARGARGDNDRPAVMGAEGDWLPIPEWLTLAGSCRLTGFVHDLYPAPHFWQELPELILAFRGEEKRSPTDPGVAGYRPLVDLVERLESLAEGHPGRGEALDGIRALLRPLGDSERPRLREVMLRSLLAAGEAIAAKRAERRSI